MAEKEAPRYERYPRLATMLRGISPFSRELLRNWHAAQLLAFTNYADQAPQEAAAMYEGGGSRGIAREAVTVVCTGWRRVMADVAELIENPGDGTGWCCPPGMMAHPDPCPQHGLALPGLVRKAPGGPGWEVYTLAGTWATLAAEPGGGA
jgi:hypothetical protein